MQKISSLVLLILIALSLASCEETSDVKVLRIYNWQDYIDDGSASEEEDATSLLDDFVEYYQETFGEEIEIVYDTFETNEVMFNTLKTGKTTYDLVCPSEYMIQRMIREDMLEEYNTDSTPIYNEYASPYIQNLFEEFGLDTYARCYMWGTLGLVYDPDVVDEEDVSSWDVMWNENYKGKVSTKDSIRDTYVVGIMHAYYDELMEYKAKYQNNEIDSITYNQKVTEIMNRCDDENIKIVLKELQALKKNLFGFEVDSGKTDIVSGKICMNTAWSGDAVYSMLLAEEEDDKILAYSVPEEGSNIWFDGWVMPKGADTEMATRFIDYISMPENAARNMNMIGYTSSIAGAEIFDLVVDWYDESADDFALIANSDLGFESVEDFDDENIEILVVSGNESYPTAEEYAEYIQSYYENATVSVKEDFNLTDLNDWLEIINVDAIAVNPGDLDNLIEQFPVLASKNLVEYSYLYEYDLSYFFAGTLDEDTEAVVYTSSLNGQLYTQYPDIETVTRCSVMKDFGDQNNKVIEMWTSVKSANLPLWVTISFFSIIVLVIIIFVLAKVFKQKMNNRFKK